MELRRRTFRRIAPALLTGLISVFAGAPASSGPWTLPRGESQTFIGVEYREDESAFDAEGERNEGRRRQFSTKVMREYGVRDYATVGVTLEARQSELDGDGEERTNTGVTAFSGHLRTRLRQVGGLVTAAQIGAEVASDYDPKLRPELGDGASELELRWLAGYGMGGGYGGAWFSAETAYAARNQDAADQLRVDGTAGFRPAAAPGLILMVQSFATLATGPGDRSDYDALKLAPSVAYQIGDAGESVTVRLGAGREVLTRNVEPATTIMVDFWIDF